MAHAKKKPNEKRSPERPVEPPRPDPRKWDEVDEASWESFPASDPPPYGGRSKEDAPDKDKDDANRKK